MLMINYANWKANHKLPLFESAELMMAMSDLIRVRCGQELVSPHTSVDLAKMRVHMDEKKRGFFCDDLVQAMRPPGTIPSTQECTSIALAWSHVCVCSHTPLSSPLDDNVWTLNREEANEKDRKELRGPDADERMPASEEKDDNSLGGADGPHH
mmetsp:Transcript_34627/g.73747  ORF Transcript_34627/g.73747 Transcript_34627/m.73747 type:complete len:154 (-) Transcript_34627:368-829(-)